MRTPQITIITPVYNGERYLAQAVKSIVRQTFDDFNFIIIDDGSTDQTGRILETFSQQDRRIQIIRNAHNTGIVHALNQGLKAATGTYIARIDADDIAAPDRLRRQMVFLDTHPDVALVGSWAKIIDEQNRVIGSVRQKTRDSQIKIRLLLGNQFIHGSVLFQRAVLDRVGCYRDEFPWNEDYDLWLRISRHYAMANIPEYLVYLRAHSANVSNIYAAQQLAAARQLRQRYATDIAHRQFKHVRQALRINPNDEVIAPLFTAVCRKEGKIINLLGFAIWAPIFRTYNQAIRVVKKILKTILPSKFIDVIRSR